MSKINGIFCPSTAFTVFKVEVPSSKSFANVIAHALLEWEVSLTPRVSNDYMYIGLDVGHLNN